MPEGKEPVETPTPSPGERAGGPSGATSEPAGSPCHPVTLSPCHPVSLVGAGPGNPGLLTLRDHASAVAFVTGHEKPNKEGAKLDWRALAPFPGTLVVYMGLSRLGAIV